MQTIGIIGAGQMGSGIAQVSAQAGYAVLLQDRDPAIAHAARARIGLHLENAAAKGKLPATAPAEILDRITIADDLAALGPAFLVIEAATEREEVKHAIFKALHDHLDQEALLATNTSSIPITRLAQSAHDPARFMGVHFFNPVPVMKPVELIRGLATADSTVAAVEQYAVTIGKSVVHANDAPGFIVNRVLLPLINEAVFALGEGVASIADIDAAVTLGLNHPMGPLTLADFIGLDTCLEIARVLHSSTGDPKFRPAPLLSKYVEAGWLGRKSGRGFYDYTGPVPVPTR